VGTERGGPSALASVRNFLPEDADAVLAIAAQAPTAAMWSKESFLNFAGEEGSLALILELDSQIRGFLVGRLAADEAELLNLAVTAAHRRKGAGKALLGHALQEWLSRGAKAVYLEVRESNTGAIAFYEKHGFAVAGRRIGYYHEPDEPALTMVRKLTASIG
jgi:[ribosomal protein S18]-alanine N-acetyltransferase